MESWPQKRAKSPLSLWQRIVYWRMGCTWVFKGPSSGVLSNVPQKFLTALKSSGLGILKYTHRCWNKPKEENMALLYLLMVWSLFFSDGLQQHIQLLKLNGVGADILGFWAPNHVTGKIAVTPMSVEIPWIAVKPPPGSVNGPLRAWTARESLCFFSAWGLGIPDQFWGFLLENIFQNNL